MQDSPQTNISGEYEIFRLLKIGEFALNAKNGSLEITHGSVRIEQEVAEKTTQIAKQIYSKASDAIRPYRDYLIYPIVFFTSFFFFFTAINLPSLSIQAQAMLGITPKDQQAQAMDLVAYNKWMRGYFYAVPNKDLLTANNDYDHDGLTNYDEFTMRTNPTLADSDTDGTGDGVEILNGTNPWGAGKMTAAQNKLKDQINLTLVSERIAYSVSSNKGQTISANSKNFDLTRPGILSIPKLGLQVPLVFSKDPTDFDNDLEKGVIHYPGTALPGEMGTMYVSGHSSDYIWKRDKFATVFTKINYLSAGDDIFVTVYGPDWKIYNYRYRVTTQKIYSPDDQTQFIDNTMAKLNLSTCWPIGTSKDRLVVSAVLSPL